MGSSLTVTPAAHVPRDVAKSGKLIIINLQSTPLDKIAYLRINGLCDDVMRRLALKLKLKVQDFVLKRLVSFRALKDGLQFRGVDSRNVPFSFLKAVKKGGQLLKGEPYFVPLKQKEQARVTFQFYRYLGEPDLEVVLDNGREGTLMMEYNPKVGEWVKKQWHK